MLVVISGEGKTDVGIVDGQSFYPGPMAYFVDQWIASKYCYSVLEAEAVWCVPEAELVRRSKHIKPRIRRGKKGAPETKFYYKNARALALIAKGQERSENTPVLAVLFRDSDGTQSSGRGEWRHKFDSMLTGFWEEGFEYGVPMIPKPQSEAWILCALREQYAHCHALEHESGNDGSPKALKDQLEAFLETSASRELLVDKIQAGLLDMTRIHMPSMQAFRNRLDQVLEALPRRN